MLHSLFVLMDLCLALTAIDPAGLVGPPDDKAQQDQNDTCEAENKWHAEPGGDNAAEDWSSHRADLLGSE